ncbi:MAG: DUF1772 domain-containing protein [Acidimicrobiales bacterium]
MNRTRTIVLFIATLAVGTIAGFFLTYGGTIMPGLATVDDRSFVAAFQGLERTFGSFETTVNWPVIVGFIGGPALIVAAIVLNRTDRPIVMLTSAALILSIATIILTQTFNVPLNNEITDAGDPNIVNVTQVREDFREGWWRAWNWVRSATSTAAFACLAWTLVLRGREDKARG